LVRPPRVISYLTSSLGTTSNLFFLIQTMLLDAFRRNPYPVLLPGQTDLGYSRFACCVM
jgi:hypothetical protein